MKFSATAAASVILALSNGNGASHAFVMPSSPLISSRTTSARLSASTTDDPYSSVLDAISSAADAASTAATTSAQLASSLSHSNSDIHNTIASTILMTPEAISAAQTKLSILEANLATSSDPAVMSRAIMDALDASIHAAEHAVSSTSVLTSNLANFDAVLSNSMAVSQFHLMTPEAAEVAQAKLALLIHNLSGASVEDTFITNVLADLDRKLDAMSAVAGMGSNGVSAGTVVMYGTLAFVLAYSQRRAGVQGYKKELRMMLEGGEFDIDVLAKEVGLLTEEATAITANNIEVQLEDPGIVMAAITNEEPVVMPMPMNKREEEAQEVEVILTMSIAALTEKKSNVAATTPVATPKPPVEDIPMKTLMEAAASDEVVKAAVKPSVEPENAVVVEFSKKEKVKVKVVQKKKKKVVVAPPPRPAASPLARLLAEELGLDLRNLGKGSGKNEKILIDDVRQFQARMEKAKNSMANNMAGVYFATAVSTA